MRNTCSKRLSTGLAVFLCGMLAGGGARAQGPAADALPPPQGAVAVVIPDRGFVDDAFALSSNGSLLYYVNTDGASWATLRAVGLRPDARSAPKTPAGPPAQAAPDGFPPLRTATAGPSAKAPAPAAALPASHAAEPAVALAPGQSIDLLSGLPLTITRVVLLPEDRVLLVMRDLDTAGVVRGMVYSLRSRTAVPVSGASADGIGPASDIVVTGSVTGAEPLILAVDFPTDHRAEYRLQTFNAATLKPLFQHKLPIRERDGRIVTAQGSAMPLYFIDDYQTLVAKHDGFYDKKKDIRQPDFLALLDALTGKVRRSFTISDPAGLLELTRLHKDHSASAFPLYDAETQKLELFASAAHLGPEPTAAAETRSELRLARPTGQYDGATLRYELPRRDRLLFSLTVDPVNEQAIAQHRTDPNDIDLYVVDLKGTAAARKLLTLPGHKRPSDWTATSSGRLALLRKHKNFPRGGTQIEVYDLDLDGNPAP
jgi:hypothetical protein